MRDKHRWTMADCDELERRWKAGETVTAISKALGVTPDAVTAKRHHLGLAARPPRAPAQRLTKRAGKSTLPPLRSLT